MSERDYRDDVAWQQAMDRVTSCAGCGSLLLRDWPKAHDCPGEDR